MHRTLNNIAKLKWAQTAAACVPIATGAYSLFVGPLPPIVALLLFAAVIIAALSFLTECVLVAMVEQCEDDDGQEN